MKDIYHIDKGFESYQDEYFNYIEELKKRDFTLDSGLIFLDAVEIEKDLQGAISKLQDPKNQSWGILQEEVERIEVEYSNLIVLFEEFYDSNIAATDKTQSLSPHEIQYIIHKNIIRIKRMVCVLDPDYSIIKFKDKKTANNYTMIKGYWINVQGKRNRSLSRSISNDELGIQDLTTKLFKANRPDLTSYIPASGSKFIPDVVVQEGDKKWIVETKLQNRDDFIKTFVMFEMWKEYKKTYNLIE